MSYNLVIYEKTFTNPDSDDDYIIRDFKTTVYKSFVEADKALAELHDRKQNFYKRNNLDRYTISDVKFGKFIVYKDSKYYKGYAVRFINFYD